MKSLFEASRINGQVVPKHEIEILCRACGYDLDESELAADKCSDCGADLELQQNVAIHATTLPAAGGGVA